MTPDLHLRRHLTASRWALVLALALFLALGAYQLSLPGLHYDEAKEAGVNAMQIVTGQPVTAFRDATIRLGPLELPLMVQDYIGAGNVALAVPFLAVGGVNVVALRWMPLLLAALTLALVWRVAGDLGGPLAAALAALLLAVSPSFVFWSRQGIFVTNLTALIFVASLFFGLRWVRGGRAFDLCAAAFLWGLGLYSKLLFVWAIGGMVLVGLAAWAFRRRGTETRFWSRGFSRFRAATERPAALSWPDGARTASTPMMVALGALVAFVIPLTPLILFNVRTGGTFISLFGNLGRSYYGVDNSAYLQNLATRIGQVNALVRGDHFWYLGEEFANGWAPWLLVGLLLAGLLAARPPTGGLQLRARWRLTAVIALFALAVAQSAFTVSDLFITHYILILPLIPLGAALAAAAVVEGRRGRGGRLLAAAALVAVLAWWGGDLWTTARYHAVLSKSGGYGGHSDAIYGLSDYLIRYEPAAPLALDWGLDAPVRFLTKGRVNPIEVFGYESLEAPDPGFEGRVAPFLDDPRTVYVAHTPDATVFKGRVEALAALAKARGLDMVEEKFIFGRNGQPPFVVYRVVAPSE